MNTIRFLFLVALGFVGACLQVSQSEARGTNSSQIVVNGVQVYSNKSLTSVVNTRVTFTDGSWADVATGQVINNGGGCISLNVPCGVAGSSADLQKPTKIGPQTFKADELAVENLDADLTVRVVSGKGIKVTIEGVEEWAKSVSMTVEGQTLRIMQPSSSFVGGTVISGGGIYISSKGNGNGNGITIVGSGNVVTGLNQAGTANKVIVEVPRYVHVSMSGVNGKSVIGDTEGPIEATASGSQDITIGKVADAVLTVGGSGNIRAQTVNGTLNMTVGGSGDLMVQGGNVQALTVNVGGSGDASFRGTAQTAVVAVGGSGDAKIAHVVKKPVVSVGGSGDVSIDNWRSW